MNYKVNAKNKKVGYWLSSASAVVGFVNLILYFIYVARGMSVHAGVIVCSILAVAIPVYLFFDDRFSGIVNWIPAPLYGLAFGFMISEGYLNIVDRLSGIAMFGDPELAGLNYAMSVLWGAAAVLTVISCFIYRKTGE